jgi:hypothetical protein
MTSRVDVNFNSYIGHIVLIDREDCDKYIQLCINLS